MTKHHKFKSPTVKGFAIVGALAATLAFTGTASADTYKGKTLTFWIGGGVSGGINAYGRAWARHAMRHLPGKPDFAARNLPGAGGMGAVTTLFNRAKKDGTHFGTFGQGPITDPLLRPKKKFAYDMQKFIWLGSLVTNIQTCYVRSDSGIKTIQDARDNAVKMAATGARSGTSKTPLTMNAAIGTRFVPITGYRGSGGTYLAIERGETAGRCASYSSLKVVHSDWIEKKYVRFLVQLSPTPHPQMKDVPLAFDLALNERGKNLLRFMYLVPTIANAITLPPGTAPARVKEWQAAWNATLNDSAFRADAKKLRLDINPKSGDQVLAVLKEIYATPKDIVRQAETAFRARKGRCNPEVSKKCKKKKKKKKKNK